MSDLTNKILQNIDYNSISNSRKENFKYLHKVLGKKNKLHISFSDEMVPLVYPYWSDKSGLREHLVQSKIYTAQYWPNVMFWCSEKDLEAEFAANIVHIPIDQRYNITNMEVILQTILNYK